MVINMKTFKTIELPKWLRDELKNPVKIDDETGKMKYVLDLASKNIDQKTGGPFAAAIFDTKTNELISAGVNMVVESNCSMAHAEIVAIALAEEKLKTFRLEGNYSLVSSAQPCVMCNGAVLWSGVKTLVYGATKDDVEEIVGFDEGPLHPHWVEEFKNRGIKVVGKIQHDKAREVLQHYKDSEGILY
jgi:tRNA(Arg) A34 adenosine deaminase TadA